MRSVQNFGSGDLLEIDVTGNPSSVFVPFTLADVPVVDVAAVLRALNAQGVTILAVEHDMSFVQQIADRVTVLHFGEIFAQGSVAEIISHPGVADIYLGASDD